MSAGPGPYLSPRWTTPTDPASMLGTNTWILVRATTLAGFSGGFDHQYAVDSVVGLPTPEGT